MGEVTGPIGEPEDLSGLKGALDDGGLNSHSRVYPRSAFDSAVHQFDAETRHKLRCETIDAMLAPVNGVSPFLLQWMEEQRDEFAAGAMVKVRAAALAGDVPSLAAMGFEMCTICGGRAEVCSACMGNGARKKR